MRALFVLTPIALIGGFAIHQALSGPDICTDEHQVGKADAPGLVALPAVPAVPAVPDVPAVPAVPAVPDAAEYAALAELSELSELSELAELSSLATLSEDIEIRIPREAIERASRLAADLQLRAEAHADIEVTLNEVMHLIDEHLSDLDGATIESFEDLGLSEGFFEDLAESIRSSVSVEVNDGERETFRVPKRRRN
jgi:hypothetical protein